MPRKGSVIQRARQSEGASDPAIHEMVQTAIEEKDLQGGTLIDIGCGGGALLRRLADGFGRKIGVDVVRYPGLPKGAEFQRADLESSQIPLPNRTADVCCAVEVIEHVENPRALFRELVRLTKPGGWVIVTTPNQLSLLSKLTLLTKDEFTAFRETSYPAHLSALLSCDLKRIAKECGLERIEFRFSLRGRIVFTARHYPSLLSRLFPKSLSDSILIMGRVRK